MTYKILIVENQYHHFKEIKTFLNVSPKYEVYPRSEEKFFIDYVRVFLNGRYPQDKHIKAREGILNYLKAHAFDLLILDHKLIGSYGERTGIELAKMIRDENDPNVCLVPIIFFSASRSNESSVKRNKNTIRDCEWIEKGYIGSDMPDESYFNEHVKPIIDAKLGSLYGRVANELKALGERGRFAKLREDIKEIGKLLPKMSSIELRALSEVIQKILEAEVSDDAESLFKDHIKTLNGSI